MGLRSGDLFNAFYEATAAIAFDFASGLAARADAAASIVAASYEDVWQAHQQGGAPYHVVPLLADVYVRSMSSPRPAAHTARPGAEAIDVLGEPHRSVLLLTERHHFSPEDTGRILGIGPEEVRRDHDDARLVVHGVSAALALCPGGVATCPQLAATLDPTAPIVAQTEAILAHAERCPYCSQAALASPDPIKELRYGASEGRPNGAVHAPAPSAAGMEVPPGVVGAPVVGAAAAAAVWSAAPAGASPLPGPAQPLAAKATAAEKAWAPKRLWNNATGWQKSGAIVAVLLIVALAIAIAAGGESEDVAARTNTNGGGTTPQGSVSSSPPPMATIPSTTTTTGPVTSTVQQTPSTSPPSTSPFTSSSSSGSSASGGSSASTPATTEAPPTTTPPAPPPEIQSGTWQQQWKGWDPKDQKSTYTVVFTFATTGTSTSYTTSMGPGGQVAAGSGALTFEGVKSGSQILTLTTEGPGGSVTERFTLVLP